VTTTTRGTMTTPWPAPLHSRPSTAIGGLNIQSAASLEIGANTPPLRAGSIPTPKIQEGHRGGGGDGTGAVGELQGETVQQPRPPRGVVRHSVLVPGDKQWGREHRNTNRFLPHSREIVPITTAAATTTSIMVPLRSFPRPDPLPFLLRPFSPLDQWGLYTHLQEGEWNTRPAASLCVSLLRPHSLALQLNVQTLGAKRNPIRPWKW